MARNTEVAAAARACSYLMRPRHSIVARARPIEDTTIMGTHKTMLTTALT